MKVTYEFNDKDDNYSLEIFQQAMQMHSALNQIKEEFRQLGKYNNLGFTIEEINGVVQFEERFLQIVKENNVNLDI